MRRTLRTLAIAAACLLAGCAVARTGQGAPAGPMAGSAAAPSAAASAQAIAHPAPSPSIPATPKPPRPPNPCSGNTAPQLVKVSVAAQHEWMCAGRTVAYQTAVTTGIPTDDFHTPTGSYVVQAKETHQTLTLLSGDRYVVDYWIPFDAPLFGFHDSSWQTFPYGSARYRTDGSHGCVHMPHAAIAWLYTWAQVGTPVVIT